HPATVVAERLGGSGDVDVSALGERLPVVERFELRELVGVLLDQVGDPEEEPLPIVRAPADPRPVVERAAGGADGALDVLGVALRNAGQHLAGRRVRRLERFPRGGVDPLPVDQHLPDGRLNEALDRGLELHCCAHERALLCGFDHPRRVRARRATGLPSGGAGSVWSGAMKDLFSIDGKVALVTGGSRGIGLMIARGFVEAGATVYVSSRKADACDEAAAELSAHGTCISLPADVSTEAGARGLAEAVAKRESSLHVLVNNAGANWGAPLAEYPDAAWDKVLALNVK